MKFSKKFFRSCILLAVLLIIAALLLRVEYNRFQKSVYPLRYTEYVEKYSQEYHLEPALVYAVIRTESNFDADAESRSGARGLMQLMPDTFNWLQKSQKDNYSNEDLFSPEVNIRYGCRYLSMMMKRYDSLHTALCAYNAGSGKVDGWLKDSRYSSDGKNLTRIPYKETQNYAQSVLQSYDKYKKLYQL